MKIPLSKELIGGLPAPDSQGLVRVVSTLRVLQDGKVDLVEINDLPVGDDKKDDDDSPMPEKDLPNLDGAMDDIYAG